MSTIQREGNKVIIEGVRKISWDTGEMCEFASALVSAMQNLGQAVPYPFVMGTCGAAFRFTLNPGEWDFGNYSIRNISTDPYEPIRRAIQATGYEYAIYERGSREEDATRIVDSLERGVPVLAFHVVGPSDCCIVTGYDEGGAVLLGWSTYQDIPDDHNIPHDASGYFRKPGWHDNLQGYILIGEKGERPPLRDIYLEAVKWAVCLLRTPKMGTRCTGLEGLRAWAEEMNQAKYFPQEDEGLLGWRYVSIAINITMLRDHASAEAFLRQMAKDEPDYLPEAGLAADCYRQASQLRAGMDPLIADNFSEHAMKAVADPAARRAFADLLLQIRDKEAEAAVHLERLIERVEGGCYG